MQLQGAIEQFKDVYAGLNPVKKFTLFLVIGGVIAGFIPDCDPEWKARLPDFVLRAFRGRLRGHDHAA